MSVHNYTPYGFANSVHGAATTIGFNGQWHERVSGGYPLGNGHRTYRPGLMRFQSADSLSPFGKGGLNAYAYCAGDPVNNTDPDGKFIVKVLRRAWRILRPGSRSTYDVLRTSLKDALPDPPVQASSGILPTWHPAIADVNEYFLPTFEYHRALHRDVSDLLRISNATFRWFKPDFPAALLQREREVFGDYLKASRNMHLDESNFSEQTRLIRDYWGMPNPADRTPPARHHQ